MKSTWLRGLGVAVVSLMFAVPAYAHSATPNGGNGGLGNGMGTRMHVQSNDGQTRTNATSNHEISVYGTGTGSQFINVNRNGNVPGTMDRTPGNLMPSNANNGYRARALETAPSRGMNWGWLGLLGLLGLFGIRSRNPQRDR